MADLRPYQALLRSRLRAQTSYRRSFVLDVVGSVATGALEFVSVYVVFSTIPALGGLDFAAAALVFAFANISFSLAEIAVGHVDSVQTYIRTGTLDAMLLRPLSLLGQIVTSDLQLRRIGRAGVGLLVLGVALPQAGITWDARAVTLVVLTPVVGAAIFGAVFVATAATQFWLVDGGELTNAFTYGGVYAASYPTSIFTTPMRALLTFLLPAAFTSYLPTLLLLRLDGPPWTPAWLGWFGPAVAAAAWAGALRLWRRGVARYTGTGS